VNAVFRRNVQLIAGLHVECRVPGIQVPHLSVHTLLSWWVWIIRQLPADGFFARLSRPYLRAAKKNVDRLWSRQAQGSAIHRVSDGMRPARGPSLRCPRDPRPASKHHSHGRRAVARTPSIVVRRVRLISTFLLPSRSRGFNGLVSGLGSGTANNLTIRAGIITLKHTV
jgi:hypothetical protein